MLPDNDGNSYDEFGDSFPGNTGEYFLHRGEIDQEDSYSNTGYDNNEK